MIFSKQIQDFFARTLLVRHDNAQELFYFGASDFPGLCSHAFDFPSAAGHMLKGFFYHYDDPIPGRLMVFDHGMGNGHRAYMVEIERLARAGYLVYSYDHTGCMTSGGENIRGFTQSLGDLDDCLRALKAVPELKDRGISVMGHSWGGYSTMNIAARHGQITHVVSMSGFVNVERILRQHLPGPLGLYLKELMAIEQKNCPDYAQIDSVDSLKNTKARALLIASDNDPTVSPRRHFRFLRDSLSGRENIRFLEVHGRGHNPNYTDDAVAYMDRFWKEFKKCKTPEARKAKLQSCDWKRMTAQDEQLWQKILAHFAAAK